MVLALALAITMGIGLLNKNSWFNLRDGHHAAGVENAARAALHLRRAAR